MSWTECLAELAACKKAYASGLVEVRYDGKVSRYDDGAALLARIRTIEAGIAQEAAGTARPVAAFATFARG